MINALKPRNKLEFVNEYLEKPQNTTPKVHAWEGAILWLKYDYTMSLSKDLHDAVAYVDIVTPMWVDSKEW